MKYSVALRGLLAGALAAGAFTLKAADAPSDNEVLVPGTRLEQTAFQLPASVTIISAEQIATSPARTVADLLAQEAGLHVRSLFGNRAARATVDLRGFGVTGGQNTLILLDGRRLNDVDLATVNFAALPLHNIERIEIARGAGSVLYGDGAGGGTVNIVTRRPQRAATSGLIGVSGGSYDSTAVDAALSFGGERAAFNLAADHIESDGYRANNALTQRNVQLEARWDGGFAHVYTKAGLSDQELGLPGVRTVDPGAGLDELRQDRRGSNSPNDFAEERAGYLTLGFSRRLGARAGLLVDAGYRERTQEAFFDDYVGFPPFLPPGSFADFLDTRLVSASLTPRLYLDHALLGEAGRLVVGVDVYDHDYDSDRSLNPSSAGRPIHRLAVDQRSTAFYLHDLSQLNERVTMSLGARVQRVRQRAQDTFDATAPGAAQKFESGAPVFSAADTEYMAEVGWRFAVTDATELLVRGARSVRFATVDELYEFGPTFTRVFSPLDPQIAHQAELGIEHTWGRLETRLTVYAMELDDEIHFNPVSFANENLDPTRRRGIEADVRWQAASNLTLRLNYTALRATFRDGPFDGNDVPVVPRRLANVSALWSILPDLKLAASWRYVGEKPFDNDEGADFGRRIPAYDLLEAKLTFDYRGYTLSAEVGNLLDEKAFDYGVASTFTPGRFNAYPLPERHFIAGVTRRFK